MLSWFSRRVLPVAAGSLLLTPLPLQSQATAAVPLHHVAYDDLQLLVDAGLVQRAIVGQKPYSRRTLAVFLTEAAERGAGADTLPAHLQGAYARLASEFTPELQAAGGTRPSGWALDGALDRIALEYTFLDSPSRPIPNAGLGDIDAILNPLASNRSGRPIVDGHTGAIETNHRLQLGRYIAISARPRFAVSAPRGTGTSGRIELPAASARAVLGNMAVEIGRLETVFGHSDDAALAISSNAPPLEAIKVESDVPFRLPWVFGRLGWARMSFLTADLGPDQSYPHAKLTAYKGSLRVSRNVEIGLTALNHWGGEGGPEATFAERVIDILPLVDAVFMAASDVEVSNKLAGLDVRVRSERLRGAQAYVEVLLDDFDHRRLRSIVTEDAGWIAGLRLPNLGSDRSVSLRTEFHHTGLRLYQHHQFRSGITFDGNLIGNALGPRGQAALLEATKTWMAGSSASLRLAAERRANDEYRTVGDPPDYANFGFERVATRPAEHRRRATVALRRRLGGSASLLRMDAGVERVRNEGAVAGAHRTNGLLLLGLEQGF